MIKQYTGVKIEKIFLEDDISTVVDIHMQTFQGFFLTFLGPGFLRCMYRGFISHSDSGLYGAYADGKLAGFLAYSSDLSGFYKYLIKNKLISFAWYAFCGFIRKPSIGLRLLRSLTYPDKNRREEAYVELSSIGVLPTAKNMGIGSMLIDHLKANTDFTKFDYIKLETDAENNEGTNAFYVKNSFVLANTYVTPEGRKMHEYRFCGK